MSEHGSLSERIDAADGKGAVGEVQARALAEIMSTMRAMRRLRPEPVPRELLVRLVEAATLAPSASNAQAYSWVIVTEREVIRALEPLWQQVFELYWQTAPPVPGWAMSARGVEGIRRASTFQRDHFAEIPALLVACYDLSAARWRFVRRLPGQASTIAALGPRGALRVLLGARRSFEMAEAASVYPGVQNLLLRARALGLGATLTTLHLALEGEFKRVLGIPRRVKTFAIVPVGWPIGRFGPVRRRPVATAIHWQRW
jgi:nitroreductase